LPFDDETKEICRENLKEMVTTCYTSPKTISAKELLSNEFFKSSKPETKFDSLFLSKEAVADDNVVAFEEDASDDDDDSSSDEDYGNPLKW